MRFLANENFPFPSIKILREAGFQIKSILETNQGISDQEIIQIAVKENYIILTFDKDYGEIIFKYGENNPPAVIFFRHKGDKPESAGIILRNLLTDSHLQVTNKFTVVENGNIRQRSY